MLPLVYENCTPEAFPTWTKKLSVYGQRESKYRSGSHASSFDVGKADTVIAAIT